MSKKNAVSDKVIKDMEVRNDERLLVNKAEELKKTIRNLNVEYGNLSSEYANKERDLSFVINEVKVQTQKIHNLKDQISREKGKELNQIKKMQIEVEAADSEYKHLLGEARKNKITLEKNISEYQEMKRKLEQDNSRLKLQLERNQNDMKKNDYEMKQREIELQKKMDEFESMRGEIEPDLARISKIKNENELLLQKIDEQNRLLDSQKAAIEHKEYKLKISLDVKKEELDVRAKSLDREAENLAKKETDLSDKELEIRAREAELQQRVKRYTLEQKIARAEDDNKK